MVERRPVIEQEQVVFDGLFLVKDVYKLLNNWMQDRGYVYVEKRAHESVTKSGKHVEVELEPYKKFSDYAKAVFRIHFTATNVQDVTVTVDGHKQKMQKGHLIVTLDSWLETDYEQRWETQPVFYVLRSIFEKYVYVPFLSGFLKGVRDDTLHLKEQIKAYLNLERVGSSA